MERRTIARCRHLRFNCRPLMTASAVRVAHVCVSTHSFAGPLLGDKAHASYLDAADRTSRTIQFGWSSVSEIPLGPLVDSEPIRCSVALRVLSNQHPKRSQCIGGANGWGPHGATLPRPAPFARWSCERGVGIVLKNPPQPANCEIRLA